MAGQTLHDRLNAARHTLSGQNLARAVCKATTEEIIGPKKKHLDYLIQCTTEPNVSVPELCNLLIERTQHSSWVIVFKALITAHHLMCYGNERFIQCMATNSCKFHLSNFVDRAASQGYEMSTFVRRYAKYLNVKAACYRTMGADFCKMKRGKEEGVLRNMSTDSLLKSLPTLQEHLDALIEFDCNPDDLSNGVMNSGFMLLYRDLIQLFAVYNDGIINLFEHAANATTNVGPHSSSQFRLPPDTRLHSEPSKHTLRTEDAHLSVHPKNLTANGGLEKFFTMNKKHCKEALDIYKKFIVVMDKVSDFLKVAESVGIDKGNIPDLTKAPASLLEEMETHLTYLEGKKGHISTAPARANSIQTAVTALNSTGTAFTSSITSNDEINGLTIDESMRRAVEEEAAIMNQMKFSLLTYGDVELSEPIPKIWTPEEQRQKEKAVRQPASDTPSVIPSPLPPPGSAASISPATKPKDVNQQLATKAAPQSSVLDDLMSINPAPVSQQPFPQVPFTGFPAEGVNNSQPAEFVSEDAFKSAFVGTAAPEPAAYDAFGQVLLPRSSASPTSSSPVPELNDPKSSPTSKLISSDLDSSLQSLVQNLDIDGAKKPVNRTPGHQWSSPKPVTKTGGTNWAPAAHPMTNYPAPQAIQVQAMPTVSQYPTSGVFTHAQYAYQQVGPGMVAQPAYVIQGVWPTPPAGYGVMAQPMQNAVFVQAPAGMIMHPSPQRSVADGSNPNANPQATGWPASNDPFGAL